MREDPYYITDQRPTRTAVYDLDSIPVVRLDDLPPPLPKGDALTTKPCVTHTTDALCSPEEPRLFALRSDTSRSAPPRFVVEKQGEMPDGVVSEPPPRQASAPVSRQQTPSLFDRISTPPPTLPSFQQYEVPDEDARASTPEPIKVTRARKKGPSSTKKKRTVNPEG